jgi:restriction endonuclease S subunit
MQLGDLDADGNVQINSMTPFTVEKKFKHFIVKPGDLVFRGRGAGITVAVMPNTALPVIVASPLIIIRPDHKKVDPDYLVWALTNDNARRYYAQYARGSVIVGIGKHDLEKIEIQLPAIQFQKKIGKIKNLQLKESQLISRRQALCIKLLEAKI